MDKANKHDLRLLNLWLTHKNGGDRFLQGVEYDVWDEKLISDLVSISSRASADGFLRWFQEQLLPRLHHKFVDMWRVCVI